MSVPEPLLHAKQKNANAQESLKRPEELLNKKELLKPLLNKEDLLKLRLNRMR